VLLAVVVDAQVERRLRLVVLLLLCTVEDVLIVLDDFVGVFIIGVLFVCRAITLLRGVVLLFDIIIGDLLLFVGTTSHSLLLVFLLGGDVLDILIDE